jgi:hypothetical protein
MRNPGREGPPSTPDPKHSLVLSEVRGIFVVMRSISEFSSLNCACRRHIIFSLLEKLNVRIRAG